MSSGEHGSPVEQHRPVESQTLVTLIARQPILNRDRKVFGYELVYQPADPLVGARVSPEIAASLVTEVVESVGLDTLTHGRPAFVRMPTPCLEGDLVRALPTDRVVVEVSCEQAAAATVEACKALRADGYRLALADFAMSDRTAGLLPLADFVKVDFLRTPSREARAWIAAGRDGLGAAMIAERVDANEVFDEAYREGFTHFQGYFFERRRGQTSGAIPFGQLTNLRLLQALSDPNLSIDRLEDLVKRDASLCYRVLRTVNSAGFAQSREITSIRQALVLLGRDTVRRWASLWVLTELGAGAHSELVVMASVRARFCELLTARARSEECAGEGFLVGMCSLLDVILNRPMAAVLDELPLAAEVRAALVGRDNSWRQVLDCAIAYERADWEACLALARLIGLDQHLLPAAFTDAIFWAHELQQSSTAIH